MRIAVVCFLFFTAAAVFGQDEINSGYGSEFLAELNRSADRIVQLAEAVPEELYDWRPAEGVRSFREVFVHMAEANYSLPGLAGIEPPEWYERGKIAETVHTKTGVIEALRTSIEHHHEALRHLTDDDFNEPVRWFGGNEVSRRAAYLSITRHTGEHLGQLIAYARMNDIVPPWSR